MKNIFLNTIILMLVTATLTAQKNDEKHQKKEDQKNRAYNAMQELIDSGNYLFDPNYISPGITLATIPNRFIVKDGEVDIDLPFYGTGRGAGGYNTNPYINYKGVPDKYNVKYIDKKRRSIIKIGVRSGSERHDITLTVGYGGQTTVKVISSARSSINYIGHLKPIKEENIN
ncbi:MAG: DUF4251 domain-containing protein [Eudoraea sp.]|nr:DUF4251 domain-containing protein [Eudoraea sp.]MBT8293045.1 DUF4251 domain-containing protein [Eudoraea sp.]NNL03456.1 DUF4251 domain-containing protein [Eudoraea sp.]